MKPVVDLVAGTRPNFMKLAPVVQAILAQKKLKPRIVHTGQHYDRGMNHVFFKELGIPKPEFHLNVGSGAHGAQTAKILERYEAHLMEFRPNATVVFGDVNSTVACALAAVKLGISVAHVEAGLRSFDRTMPEEINRILTDAISDLFLVSEESGVANLRREGIQEDKIHLVGNVMIDTLVRELVKAKELNFPAKLGLKNGGYALVTLHRPSNVDNPLTLGLLLHLLKDLSQQLPIVFPVHPRTLQASEKACLKELLSSMPRFMCIDPIPYRENLSLMTYARVVLTDSGGMQEETTFLKVPCLTLRENTERPVTVEKGTSRLVGIDPNRIRKAFSEVLAGKWPEGELIPLWDGKSSDRIAGILAEWMLGKS